LSGIDPMPPFTEALDRTVAWLADHAD